MTDADKKQFAGLLGALGEIFGQEVSKPKLKLYFAALRDLTIEQIERATEQIAGSAKFFPRPVEIREAVEGSIQDRAAVAWQTFLGLCERSGYPSLQIADGALRFAIEEMGGYREAVAKVNGASPEMARAYQKSFEQFYKIGQARGASGGYLLGEFEARNRTLGSWIGLRDGKPVEVCEIETPVLVVSADRVIELRMPLDLQTGRLAEFAQNALQAGGDALTRYLPAPTPQMRSLAPIAPREMASPEEVAAIQAEISALAGRRMPQRLLAAPDSTPTETDAIQ